MGSRKATFHSFPISSAPSPLSFAWTASGSGLLGGTSRISCHVRHHVTFCVHHLGCCLMLCFRTSGCGFAHLALGPLGIRHQNLISWAGVCTSSVGKASDDLPCCIGVTKESTSPHQRSRLSFRFRKWLKLFCERFRLPWHFSISFWSLASRVGEACQAKRITADAKSMTC